MTSWTATTGQYQRSGTAAHLVDAWRCAVEGAVAVAGETGGAEAVVLTVGGETARLYPALDEAGELDAAATREAGLLMVSVVEDEQAGPDRTPD